ncbi:MAG: hypothetical protein WCI11_19250 [Candidatus Methylumidiphilus sp.]
MRERIFHRLLARKLIQKLSIALLGCMFMLSVAPQANEPPSADGIDRALPVNAKQKDDPVVQLDIPAEIWTKHVIDTLMPFWTMPSAFGKSKSEPFPTYRCKDGLAYGEPSCDFADIKAINAQFRKNQKKDGPFEWLSGPNNELFNREYIRTHSRQTYAYGVAYHLTGDAKYLKLAHRGVQWLMVNAIDKEHGGSYTYMDEGKGNPAYTLRTSQDQSYTMMGFSFYYYLTRDPEVFKALTKLKNDVMKTYLSPDWEGGRIVKWMLETKQETVPTCLSTIPAPDKGTSEQKEMVAPLDQVNAYMLLTTQTAPTPADRELWLKDLHFLAVTIRDRFYNDGEKSKHQVYTGISPIVPQGMFAGCLTYKGPILAENGDCRVPIDPENCDPSNHHTDFGHSIKSFWMLYLIGREAGDKSMEQFGVNGAKDIFKRAFYKEDGSWARAYIMHDDSGKPLHYDPEKAKQDTNKEWWIYAELDQMADTLALIDPAEYVPYLNKTYNYWLRSFVKEKDFEVPQWVYDPSCEIGNPKNCDNELIPKANLWKNAFHSTEHGLVAYISTSGVNQKPATLYYALVTKELPSNGLHPYYYREGSANIVNEGIIEGEGVTFQKVRAEFTNIK